MLSLRNLWQSPVTTQPSVQQSYPLPNVEGVSAQPLITLGDPHIPEASILKDNADAFRATQTYAYTYKQKKASLATLQTDPKSTKLKFISTGDAFPYVGGDYRPQENGPFKKVPGNRIEVRRSIFHGDGGIYGRVTLALPTDPTVPTIDEHRGFQLADIWIPKAENGEPDFKRATLQTNFPRPEGKKAGIMIPQPLKLGGDPVSTLVQKLWEQTEEVAKGFKPKILASTAGEAGSTVLKRIL